MQQKLFIQTLFTVRLLKECLIQIKFIVESTNSLLSPQINRENTEIQKTTIILMLFGYMLHEHSKLFLI